MSSVSRFGRKAATVVGAGVLLWSGATRALPPGGEARGFVDGANHHVGDASFLERFGRAPGDHDSEAVRMHTHLAWIRAELGRRPATRPELAARRATLLGYLDDYIAKGTTPLNVDLPWRNPVFIDALGQVCAVGYLIERDVGRDVAEAIAAAHRTSYLEDIARAMPAVAAWIDASGFTLDELASIQPGYEHPAIDNWELMKVPLEGHVVVGDAKTVGAGDFSAGNGRWRSTYGNGAVLAEGAFKRHHPDGPWRIYHASGNLAAEGSFRRGVRDGEWRFYDDTAARTLVSVGTFAQGSYSGRWQHYDRSGAKVAATYDVPAGEMSFGEHVVDYTMPSDPGVRVRVHVGNVAGDGVEVDLFDVGGERFATRRTAWEEVLTELRDSRGRLLARAEDGHWTRTTCRESREWRRAVSRGDIVAGHDAEDVPCATTEPVPAKTAALLERLTRARAAPEPEAPRYLASLVAAAQAATSPDDTNADDPGSEAGGEAGGAEVDAVVEEPPGLFRTLVNGMTWYVEHDHVDRLFDLVFATLPDRVLGDGFPDEGTEDAAAVDGG